MRMGGYDQDKFTRQWLLVILVLYICANHLLRAVVGSGGSGSSMSLQSWGAGVVPQMLTTLENFRIAQGEVLHHSAAKCPGHVVKYCESAFAYLRIFLGLH